MIQESLQYLRTDEDRWVRTVLIGGILSLLSVLVIPTFLVLGYLPLAHGLMLVGIHLPHPTIPVYQPLG